MVDSLRPELSETASSIFISARKAEIQATLGGKVGMSTLMPEPMCIAIRMPEPDPTVGPNLMSICNRSGDMGMG